MDAAPILRQSPFFAALQGAPFERLVAMARVREYPVGLTIFADGDVCPGVFVVGEGRVRVYKLAPNGREHVLHFVTQGGTFAEVAAIGSFPLPAFAEAEVDTTCVLLPAGPFRRALDDDHGLCLQLMGSLTRWVRHLVGRLEDLTLRDAAGRVARHLLDAPRDERGCVTLPGAKKHVASHLGLTSETFSRCLRKLADLGAIATDPGGDLRLLDPARLEAIAEGELPLV